jgi:arylsulfatase
METVDEETLAAATDLIKRQHAAGKPFFTWWNGTRMHFRTHVKAEHRAKSGQDEYSDGMVEHDGHVGQLLKLLDDLGIANDTIVFYSTDNGPHYKTPGPTPARLPSAARRTRTGRAPTACPRSCAGPASSPPG